MGDVLRYYAMRCCLRKWPPISNQLAMKSYNRYDLRTYLWPDRLPRLWGKLHFDTYGKLLSSKCFCARGCSRLRELYVLDLVLLDLCRGCLWFVQSLFVFLYQLLYAVVNMCCCARIFVVLPLLISVSAAYYSRRGDALQQGVWWIRGIINSLLSYHDGGALSYMNSQLRFMWSCIFFM